jgi:hypothetical protein
MVAAGMERWCRAWGLLKEALIEPIGGRRKPAPAEQPVSNTCRLRGHVPSRRVVLVWRRSFLL